MSPRSIPINLESDPALKIIPDDLRDRFVKFCREEKKSPSTVLASMVRAFMGEG